MRWIFIVCLTFFVGAAAVAAPTNDCGAADVEVTVTRAEADPVYDFSSGIPEIQSIADIVVHRVRSGWAFGFTRAEPVLQMDAPIENNTVCVRPRYVHATIGYKNQTVYIPREIPAESCAYHEVVEHEQKHLAANRDLVKKYAELMQARLTDYVKNNKMVLQGDAEQSASVMRNMLHAVLNDVAERMIAENAVLQGNIDSADEYHRLLTVCDGQLATLEKEVRQEPRLATGY